MINYNILENGGSLLLRKVPIGKINPKPLGYIRQSGMINFLTSEEAENYAKNRCVAALQGPKPFERSILTKDNIVLAEINGTLTKVNFGENIIESGMSLFHGHPNISANGTLPLSLDDYLCYVGNDLNKIVAFNKKGEYSAIIKKNSKSIFMRLLPLKWQEKLKLIQIIGDGSIAAEKYATMYSKLFPKEIQNKVRNHIHSIIGKPYADYNAIKAAKKDKLTTQEFTIADKAFNNMLRDNTFAEAIHSFWIDLSKKLNFRYETNFSNLK